MTKSSLLVSGLVLFSSAVLIGINVSNEESSVIGNDSDTSTSPVSVDQIARPNPWKTSNSEQTLTDKLNVLENKIAQLEARIIELEQTQDITTTSVDSEFTKSTSTTPQHNKALTTDLLIEAGISDSRAAEIIRQRNSIELKKLELNDRATREGYKGSARYRRELSELTKDLKPLREELGDEAYDYYLYASGQTNRVEVLSVMQSSAAEQTGLQTGDHILSYDQNRMFNWIELKRATAEGELGEYVSIDILRDGQRFNLWVPRGPLGVMLGTASEAP